MAIERMNSLTTLEETEFSNILDPPGYLIKIKLDVVAEKTKGGIYLPEDKIREQKYRVSTGIVVAMGPECYDRAKYSYNWCNIGDRISFSKDIGILFRENDEDYKLIKDDDINGTYKRK